MQPPQSKEQRDIWGGDGEQGKATPSPPPTLERSGPGRCSTGLSAWEKPAGGWGLRGSSQWGCPQEGDLGVRPLQMPSGRWLGTAGALLPHVGAARLEVGAGGVCFCGLLLLNLHPCPSAPPPVKGSGLGRRGGEGASCACRPPAQRVPLPWRKRAERGWGVGLGRCSRAVGAAFLPLGRGGRQAGRGWGLGAAAGGPSASSGGLMF